MKVLGSLPAAEYTPKCRVLHAQALFKLESFESAAKKYEEALEHDPENNELASNLFSCYVEGGLKEKALKLAEEKKELLSPMYEYWFNRACLESVTQEFSKAKEDLQRAEKMCDEDGQDAIFTLQRRILGEKVELPPLPSQKVMDSCIKKEEREKSFVEKRRDAARKAKAPVKASVSEATLICASATLAQLCTKKEQISSRYARLLAGYSLADTAKLSYTQRALALFNAGVVMLGSTELPQVKKCLDELKQLSETSKTATECYCLLLCKFLSRVLSDKRLRTTGDIPNELPAFIKNLTDACSSAKSFAVKLAYAQLLFSYRRVLPMVVNMCPESFILKAADVLEEYLKTACDNQSSFQYAVVAFRLAYLFALWLKVENKANKESKDAVQKRLVSALVLAQKMCLSSPRVAVSLSDAVLVLGKQFNKQRREILKAALGACAAGHQDKEFVQAVVAISSPSFLVSKVKTKRSAFKASLADNERIVKEIDGAHSIARAMYVARVIGSGRTPAACPSERDRLKLAYQKQHRRALNRRVKIARRVAAAAIAVNPKAKADPERWLKIKDRSTYRKKGKRRQALARGAQGDTKGEDLNIKK